MDSIINLNVGGKLYTTSRSTLTKYPDSMLGRMFEGDLPSTKDAQGNVVIDRDGELFRFVLTFLRSARLILPENFNEMALLVEEAKFYQIPEFIEAVNPYLMKDVFMLNVGGKIFPVHRRYLQPDNCEEFGEVLDLNKTFDLKPYTSKDSPSMPRPFYKQIFMADSPYKDHRLILGNLWDTICNPNAVKDHQGNYIIDGNPKLFGYILQFVRTKRICLPIVFTEELNVTKGPSYRFNPEVLCALQLEFHRIGIDIHVPLYLTDQ